MTTATNIYEVPLISIAAEPFDPGLLRGRAALIVNVTSQCGLYAPVRGVAEPLRALPRPRARRSRRALQPIWQPGTGTAEEIIEFCSTSYAVTFPLTRSSTSTGLTGTHPLYELLTAAPDEAGEAGGVQWNFEKFVVSPQGEVVARFRQKTLPGASEVLDAIEKSREADRPIPTR